MAWMQEACVVKQLKPHNKHLTRKITLTLSFCASVTLQLSKHLSELSDILQCQGNTLYSKAKATGITLKIIQQRTNLVFFYLFKVFKLMYYHMATKSTVNRNLAHATNN